MNKKEIKEILERYKQMWETRFPGANFLIIDSEFGITVEFKVENFIGVFSQKFLITPEMLRTMDITAIGEMVRMMERTLNETAISWFLCKHSPLDK